MLSVPFMSSQTRKNLMAAFAGESQARNRYTIAASVARQQKLYIVENVFLFTAEQEREHGQIFYNYLAELSPGMVEVEASYPIDPLENVTQMLLDAKKNEYIEYEKIYKQFGDRAMQEGYSEIASSFYMIGQIEQTHGDRFHCYASLMEREMLFKSQIEVEWMCLVCGHIHFGKEAPLICPVCGRTQGNFIRRMMEPYACIGNA